MALFGGLGAVALLLAGIFAAGSEAATAPTLVASNAYSVLGHTTVTNSGSTTANRAVGISPGTSITGFPPGQAGGGTHSNDASAMAAKADSLIVFDTLDQPCDQSFGAVDLTVTFPSGVGPGVYCSTSAFSLSGNLNLTGSGVWIFKTGSTLITSSGSSITGGTACSVWWRIGSSATLATTTSFKGNIFAQADIGMLNGASLNGRAVALTGQVTMISNTISTPSCNQIPTSTTVPATATAAAAATATREARASATERASDATATREARADATATRAARTAAQTAAATATQSAATTAATPTPLVTLFLVATPTAPFGVVATPTLPGVVAPPAHPGAPTSTPTPSTPSVLLPPQAGDGGLLPQTGGGDRIATGVAFAALFILGAGVFVLLRPGEGRPNLVRIA